MKKKKLLPSVLAILISLSLIMACFPGNADNEAYADPPASIGVLQVLYDSATEKLGSDEYTTATENALETAYAAAGTVLEKGTGATEEEASTASNALEAAIEALTLHTTPTQVGVLTVFLSMSVILDENRYTPLAWARFESARDNIQEIISSPADYSTVEANAALNEGVASLTDALLSGVKADLDELLVSIAVAQGIIDNQSSYVRSSLDGLDDAIVDANAVVNDSNATQGEVNDAKEALNAKIAVAQLTVDKNALQLAYNAAMRVDKSLYTDLSVQVLTVATSVADAVLNAADSTQEQADHAALSLSVAIVSLIAKPSTDTVQTPDVNAPIKVEAPPNNISTLKKITKSTGKFSSAFKPSKTAYKLTIAKSKTSVKIKATKNNAKQKIQIKVSNGKYRAVSSVTVKVKKGKHKTVWIKVTSESGAAKTYKIKVVRKK